MNILLQDFVARCVFIHDDYEYNLKVENEEFVSEQYPTNAFMLGAKYCVVESLAAFGEPYIAYLKSLNSFPEKILIPHRKSNILTENLLLDEDCLSVLKELIFNARLSISTFYSDSYRGYNLLISKLEKENYTPNIYPPINIFEKANSKVKIRKILEKNRIPIPEGQVCNTKTDLLRFLNKKRLYKRILLKQFHYKVVELSDTDELEKLEDLQFPLVAETCYDDVISSPVSHFINWNGKTENLFTLDQLIYNWNHQGNKSSSITTKANLDTILQIGTKVITALPQFRGVLGIDFIITSLGDILVVDVNPRFNSSTYPYYFLQRLGLNLDKIFVVIKTIQKKISNLSVILIHPAFIPLRQNNYGMFVYNPVWDYKNEAITKFSYMCVASSEEELANFEKTLQTLILDVAL